MAVKIPRVARFKMSVYDLCGHVISSVKSGLKIWSRIREISREPHKHDYQINISVSLLFVGNGLGYLIPPMIVTGPKIFENISNQSESLNLNDWSEEQFRQEISRFDSFFCEPIFQCKNS